MSSAPESRLHFLEQYRLVRHAEGRGSPDPDYYRSLPFADFTGKNSAMWAMRARTYRFFEERILSGWERQVNRPLDILDLGAGNCWMTYRLMLRNHRAVALDIFNDPLDGLRARRFYPFPVPAVEAEFNVLPFGVNSFDLIVFNASFHYSSDYLKTLSEVRHCLRPSGAVIILDSPVYRRPEHGQRMVEERKAAYRKKFGFPSDAMNSIEYLDQRELQRLSKELSIGWRIYRPWYGWRWHARPFLALLRRRRPPSRFRILVGRFGRA